MHAGPVKYDNSYYGRGLSIPAWNNLNCFGWEDTLEECSKSVNPSIYCWENSDIAGVMCKDSESVLKKIIVIV